MKIDLLNTLIKMFFLLNYTSYIYARIMNKNYSKKTCALIFIINFFLSALNLLMKSYFKTNEVMIIIIILSAIIINQISTEKIRPSAILLAFAVCIMSLVISVTAIFPLPNILNRVNNAKIVMMILMVVIQGLTICVLFRIKRFNKGLAFIKEKINNEYIDIITINISIAVIFVYTLFGNYYGNLTRHILISFIILGTIMFVMIQKTLVLYYKQKLLEKTMADYENEIKQKDEKIKVLSEEKFKISKINHEFYNRQKALEMTVNDFINNTNMEVGRELAITNKINSLSKEYSNKMKSIKQVEKLSLTGIEEIDEMFKYMQIECIKNNIDFKLKIEGNVYPLVNNIIEKDRLVTLIGDHLKDAIIAINFSKNKFKSIIAILGIKNNCYEFCICDTGIEFQIETLLKLGLEPVTTHKETGGTGIGFISTFETLKKCNASLIIDEKHEESNNDYTKSVTIKFDGKSQYIIKSYRADKIKDKAEDDRIIIKRNDN